ncbi:MAG TPA: FkbM family methyltransferase [Solirubrobacterales bacterium]|nr:FkbM family methyltransferase [Solirubrobacterales bacterium]
MDYRRSKLGRRRSWWGAKRHAKRLLAMRAPHALVRLAARLRPKLRRGGRLPAPAHLREVEGEAGGSRFVMLRPDRCIVAKELYWGRGRRPRAEDQLALEIVAAAAARTDVLVDVGAYTGLFTVAATRANPALRAHAFEIVPDNYRALFDNCVRNDVLDRVTLHHVGVGKPGARLRVPARSSGSALPDFYSSRLRFDTGVAIRFVALDSLLDKIPSGAAVTVKIDVEGTEAAVLRHGRRFLAEVRPLILCEVLPDSDPAPLAATLEPLGYRYGLVREGDVRTSARIEPDERYRDWLFLPGDPARELAGLAARRPAAAAVSSGGLRSARSRPAAGPIPRSRSARSRG